MAVSQAIADGHVCVDLDELVERLSGEPPALAVPTLRTLLLESNLVGIPHARGVLPLILDDDNRLYLHRYFDYECRLASSLAGRRRRIDRAAADAADAAEAANGAKSADAADAADAANGAKSADAADAADAANGGKGADAVDAERTLAERRRRITRAAANAAAAADAAKPPAPNVVALLDRLFGANAADPDAPDWQKVAVITALLGRLTIISGGPGTGKTTAVVNLLACLLEDNPQCRIALAAPTGKAAARITEALRQRSSHLPESLRGKLPTESSTIHRLLGGLPGEFRHHAANVLPIDVLIVDEASMLDLALAVHLFEAVPRDARIILLGDKDQLAAVESGAVFSELSADRTLSPVRMQTLSRLCGVAPPAFETPEPPQHTGLTDCVVWLARNYRFAGNSHIGLLAAGINAGDVTGVLARLAGPSDRSLHWLNDAAEMPAESGRAILAGYAPYIEVVREHAAAPGAIAAAFGRFRALCAVRDGARGVRAVNHLVSAHFRRALAHPLDPGLRSAWYPGRPVMVLRNDYVLKLFNGDIGIVLPDERGTLQVYFPDGERGFRAISPARLPEVETAFAMTVHKSQGSEFAEVLVVLPAEPNRVLTRELLYTAVTRARQCVSIMGSASVIASTIATATHRVSGLIARLRGCPAPPL
jgi:exodeoxyribonuclease V alpha subunit